MSVNLYYQIAVHEADGRLVRRRRRRRCHSFLGQFAQFMGAIFGVSGITGVLNISGGSSIIQHPTQASTAAMRIQAGLGVDAQGIVAGTDATAVLGTDFNMAALIAEGTGAGQMAYSAGVIGNVVVGATSATIAISRSISNSSGGTITVREVGIRCRNNVTDFQLIRDVLSVAEVVADGQILTVVYTIRIDV